MDDDDISIGPYEQGSWVWDENNNRLEFMSSLLHQEEAAPITKITGTESLEFADNPDFYDILRFQKHYQRPMAEGNDVVMLQDIKDVALFTAPARFLSISIVNILHLPATDRFLRAMIFYCQYYLQVTELLSNRSLEKKIPSRKSEEFEAELREDIEDLRFLVAKEYSSIIIGGDNFGKYHHLGPKKKQLSATMRDAVLYETLFRFIYQIVWIALGRKSGNDIEVEISRILKSDKFNFSEHERMFQVSNSVDKNILVLGHCMRKHRVLKTQSPLVDEIFCNRRIAYHMSGVGVVKYPKLTPRLRYFMRVLILPEKELQVTGVTVGILGISRKLFDPMLKELKQKRPSRASVGLSRRMSRASINTSTSTFTPTKVFPDIEIPKKQAVHEFGDEFPCETYPSIPINVNQKRNWVERVNRHLRKKRELEKKLVQRRLVEPKT